MRKLLCLLFVASGIQAHAQELQLHYDLLKERQYLTGTFEIFKPDRLGSTFMFTDVDFNRQNGGASLAYFEIARKFNIPNKAIDGLNAHIEYNDGLLITKSETPIGIPINRAVLAGVGFPVKLGNFVLNTSYLYKNIQGSNGLDGQFTAVWHQNLFNDKMTIRGFLDVWSQPKHWNDKNKKTAVLLTEPQFLYNITPKFSIGSEVEISKNFVVGTDDLKVFPTVMVKWGW